MLFIQLLVVQAIVLGGLIFLLKKILYGDTQSAMSRLDHVHQDMLKKQKELMQKIEQAESDYNAKKEEAEKIAAKVKADALAESQKKEEEIVKVARGEAQAVLDKARNSMEKNAQDMEKKLRGELVTTASNLLRTILKDGAAESLHTHFVGDFIKRGKDLDLSSVSPDVKKVVVKTAFPLRGEEQNNIKQLVGEKLSREIELEEIVDQELVAGMVLQFGTLLLDGSFSNRLKESTAETRKRIDNE